MADVALPESVCCSSRSAEPAGPDAYATGPAAQVRSCSRYSDLFEVSRGWLRV